MSDVRVMRARIEQVKELAAEYREESSAQSADGRPWDAPMPQGDIFWIATNAGSREALGYAAGTLRPEDCTVGPVFVRKEARRRGVGRALIASISQWANDTRVPVVEISVAADNPDGQAFLESLGFQPRRILMSMTPQDAKPAPAAPDA